MAESMNMTSLTDLPSNPGNIQSTQQNVPNNSSPISLDQASISQIVNVLQQATLSGATKLPSRDIPMTSDHLTNDDEARPNYIPTSTDKYIDEDYDYDINSNNQNNNLKNIYSEIQFPLLLAILYFIFQMPAFKNALFQYFTFLFASDGNYNMNGLVFLSVLFSLTYYVFANIIFKEK